MVTRVALVAPGAESVGLNTLENYELRCVATASDAVRLVRAGHADVIMKGGLHTDEFMRPIVSELSIYGRRMSHVFRMFVPNQSRSLYITDGALNIAPDLATKLAITQNAIDLAHILSVAIPKVAVLAAVETVNPSMPATLDAAALSKMADRGQITGAVVDGPLAFDNALSMASKNAKGIASPVAGRADILVVPDIECGNMLVKQLTCMADARAYGLVLGAQVPVVLTSRAASLDERIGSLVLAQRMLRGK
jgi:phosphate acetyltransferase